MYSSVIYNKEKKVTKMLVKAIANAKNQRARPDNSKKSFDHSLIIQPKDIQLIKQDGFADKLGLFSK